MPNQERPHGAVSAAEATAWFFEHGLEGFVLTRDRIIVSVNAAWSQMLGWSAEEAVGRFAPDFIHPDDAHLVDPGRERLLTEGTHTIECRLRKADGGRIWARLRGKALDDGWALFAMTDITEERQRAAEAESAARVSDLLRAAAGIYLWRFDPDSGEYTVETGDSTGKEFGAPDQISAARMTDNIHPDDRLGFGKAFLPTVLTGEAGQYSYRYVRPDGAEGWVRYRTAWRGVRQGKSGKWEIRGLTQDVTEIEEARDAALEAAETKSRFLANMSHEIRTPLNGVLGVLHLLKGEALSKGGRELVGQALACGAMLTQLLNDVLDFSKIEAGKLDLNPEPLDPVAALEGVVEMLRPAAEAKGLYLRTAIDAAPTWVSADPVRLRQVLFNLIGNAAKFTLHGGVEVRLTSVGSGARHRLRVAVQDTGVGVPPEVISRLFERFHQADGSTTRRFGGTGLGLAITRSLVEQMGGEVGAHSEPGCGSTFWFEIAAPAVEAPAPAEAEDTGLLEGLTILVVEDNPTNRLIARRMLESLGAEVETANDGAEGVEAAQLRAFDLIFMDIQMPGMDGVEATRRIRALGDIAARTPIVAMTANVMTHQIREYLAAGMDGAVGKPLDPAEILAELTRLMTRCEAEGSVDLDRVA